jgi:hypothetical protein
MKMVFCFSLKSLVIRKINAAIIKKTLSILARYENPSIIPTKTYLKFFICDKITLLNLAIK